MRFHSYQIDGGVQFGTPNVGLPTAQIAAGGYLANDIEPGDGLLRGHIVVPPAYGTLLAFENGDFVYTPVTGYTGYGNFTYELFEDGVSQGTALVTIVIGTNFVAVSTAAATPAGQAFEQNVKIQLDSTAPVAGQPFVTSGGGNQLLMLPNTVTYAGEMFTVVGNAPAEMGRALRFTNQVLNGGIQFGTNFVGITRDALNPSGFLAAWVSASKQLVSGLVTVPPDFGVLDSYENGGYAYTPMLDYEGADQFTFRLYIDGVYIGLYTQALIAGNMVIFVACDSVPLSDPLLAIETADFAVGDSGMLTEVFGLI
jgi:hypothetical protein